MRIILISILLLFASDIKAQEATTFVLIRHAEKVQDGSQDPELSEIGKQRADNLRSMFEHASVSSIYSTNFKRTQQTVWPLAQQKSLSIIPYQKYDAEWLKKIAKENHGKTVIIVGHSNTIPEIANLLLGEERFEQYPDNLYKQMLVIHYQENLKPSVLILNY